MARVSKFLAGVAVGLVLIAVASQFYSDLPPETLETRYANAASRFIHIDGNRIHFRDEGEGQPVVLLHGTGASLHTWDGWARELSPHFRILRLDLPGFGLTGPDVRHDYSMDRFTVVLAALMDSLGIPAAAIAGNSLGGRIAWEFALRHPDRTRALVLIDAAGFPMPEKPLAMRAVGLPVIGRVFRYITPRFLVEKSLKQVFYDDGLVTDSLVNRYFELTLREGNRAAYRERVLTTYAPATDRLDAIGCPVLILWGAHDVWTPLTHARLFEAQLKQAEHIVYQQAGHIPMEELPARSAADTRAFLHRVFSAAE